MNISPHLNRSPRSASAFTLTELMIVIGLLILLAVLAVPVVGSMRERTNAHLCASRLRQSGLLIQAYIVDSNNVLRVYYGGENAADLWTRKLINRRYITKRDAAQTFRCPTGKTSPGRPTDESKGGEGWLYESYGLVMMDESVLEWTAKTPPLGRWITLRVARVEAPGNFPLLADSATFTTGTQLHRIGHKLNNGDSSFALRHREAANVLFLDGHISALNVVQAKELGIPDSYLQILK